MPSRPSNRSTTRHTMPVALPVVVLVAGRKQSSSATFGVFTVHPPGFPYENIYYRSNCARCVPGYGDIGGTPSRRALALDGGPACAAGNFWDLPASILK